MAYVTETSEEHTAFVFSVEVNNESLYPRQRNVRIIVRCELSMYDSTRTIF